MSTSDEATTGTHKMTPDETILEGVEELPPLVSPGVLSSEQREPIIETERFRLKLRERWRCNEPGHDICYRAPKRNQHIPLSENDVEVWVEEWVRNMKYLCHVHY